MIYFHKEKRTLAHRNCVLFFPPKPHLVNLIIREFYFPCMLPAARGHKRMLLPCLAFFFFFLNHQVELYRLRNKQKYRGSWWILLPLPSSDVNFFICSFQQEFKFQVTVIGDNGEQKLHLPQRKRKPLKMRDLYWDTNIPNLAHLYVSELSCRALCSKAI